MLSRRSVLVGFAVAGVIVSAGADAASPRAFDARAFADAQKAGRPILVVVHASWCPTCRAQEPILAELTNDPKFRSLAYFVIDFDRQKDLVQRFGARTQSTLIAFKGASERGRSVGDTRRDSIAALLNASL